MYIATHHNVNGLTELNKELSSSVKLLKKKSTENQSVKFEHNEKMLSMQLKRENIQ
jgi:hypothetical protein